jgi:hypothetical protein
MQFVRSLQEVGYELAQQVLCCETAESECGASFGMAEIVESRGQIQIANESTGSRSCEIRKSDSVVPGIRFVDESKCQRVKASEQWILAG